LREKSSGKKKIENQINKEDQRKFEMWDEKDQWEKEETKRILEIAGLKDQEVTNKIKLAADKNTKIAGDNTVGSIFSENRHIKCLEYLYKSYARMKGEPRSIEVKRNLEYTLKKFNDESEKLSSHVKGSVQSFADNIDSNILLPLLKADVSKIEKLTNDENIAKLYVKEYLGSEIANLSKGKDIQTEADTEVKIEGVSQEKQENDIREASEKKRRSESRFSIGF